MYIVFHIVTGLTVPSWDAILRQVLRVDYDIADINSSQSRKLPSNVRYSC